MMLKQNDPHATSYEYLGLILCICGFATADVTVMPWLELEGVTATCDHVEIMWS